MSHSDSARDRSPERESAVLAQALCRAADILQVPDAILARTIGVSPASVSRLRTGAFKLARKDKAFELGLLFIRMFRGLDAITGGDDASSRSWLRAENLALRGRPIDLVQSIVGLASVVSYVDARRARV
ncbi:MbcA/ParS/Xre antitoxin family protein [Nitrospirillum sp. BR 11163]|uniref:MbcA/ParS/Xre antitoxin family protein n=1 Tax=Nitrospirillum sp. BR 11163 TaxID=3104323 RepID=UPI002AFE4EE3|nr:antitoxin Xre/MbcA/ParS toxin-binding domain-containing protein [Nitrospirillum sp. BR 11163]MEA1677371.1 antitoxin Xre/MbcA/ParS toxin-binding domain-containing protein [Nitrospirillum sp. BR 11163]